MEQRSVPLIPVLEGQRQVVAVSFRIAWSTEQIPGQPRLKGKTLPTNQPHTHSKARIGPESGANEAGTRTMTGKDREATRTQLKGPTSALPKADEQTH